LLKLQREGQRDLQLSKMGFEENEVFFHSDEVSRVRIGFWLGRAFACGAQCCVLLYGIQWIHHPLLPHPLVAGSKYTPWSVDQLVINSTDREMIPFLSDSEYETIKNTAVYSEGG
jgi:hypothetical protein